MFSFVSLLGVETGVTVTPLIFLAIRCDINKLEVVNRKLHLAYSHRNAHYMYVDETWVGPASRQWFDSARQRPNVCPIHTADSDATQLSS